MKDLHSVWLMPEAADAAMLRATIDDLAARFGAPPFEPHLTLVEDQARSLEDLLPEVERIAAGISTFASPVKAIGTSELYFRSFYALFEVGGPLLELKRRAIAAIASGRIDDFMPHISLLYGVADGPRKRAAQSELEQGMTGRPIRFDRICVVASAKEIPIDQWAVRGSVALRGQVLADVATPGDTGLRR